MDAFESFDESVALTHTKGSSFFGCYLLVSLNPRHRNKTYIGFTVDPDRRIRQHNAGRLKGGAKATSGSGPWDMVLIVHGFPNDISALRFEWAWQHPELSRRLTNVAQIRRSNETPFDYRFRILCHMLRTGPWNRLGLVVRWINQRYFRDFPADLSPPLHIPIVYGPLQSSKIVQSSSTIPTDSACDLCFKNFVSTSPQSVPASCPSEHCSSRWHLICIAKYLLRHNQDILSSRIRTADGHTDQVLPLCGACPKCHSSDIFWPKLIEDWKRRQIAIQ